MSLGPHHADTNLRLQHVFLTSMMRVFCLKYSTLSICHDDEEHFSFAGAAFCVIWLSMQSCFCQSGWEEDFSGLWLLYFCINAVLKTYLLDLYSYRKYFIFISLKERKSSCSIYCLIVSLFYLTQPEVHICSLCPDLKHSVKLTMCLKLLPDALCSNAEVACLICACGTEKIIVS